MKVYNKANLVHKHQDKTLFNFVQETATIGTWKVDTSTMKVSWCPITKRIHDVDNNFKPSLNSAILFYKEGFNRNKITKVVNDCIENHVKFDVELKLISAKNNEKWVRAIGIPIIENGNCIAINGLIQDINEKTVALKEVAHREEQLRKTFEHAVLGMAILDRDGNWIRVNDALCKMLGYSKTELRKIKFYRLAHQNDRRFDQTRKLIKGSIDNYQLEKRLIKKNGTILHTFISVSLVRDEHGLPHNFVAQINDISDYKQANLKIMDLLLTTKTQNDRLKNFAHIVSHNLRSHYSNIEMLTDLMKVEVPDSTKNEFFPMLQSAINNLGETLENLNDAILVETCRQDDIKSLNLKNYIDKTIKVLDAKILKNNAFLKINVESSTTVCCLPAYLESIILNFISNGIKYKHPNREPRIELSAKKSDKFVIIKFKDNGLGINLEKYKKKIFGMYKTFHEHKNARGLGLYITKNQVEAMGGKIEVDSKINEGTTFKVYLRHEH